MTLRDELRAAFADQATAQERLRTVGIAELRGHALEGANRLIDRLGLFGIFVVPIGGVESWLRYLGVTGKSDWLQRIFQQMGEVPSASGYVTPAHNDVWAFVERVSRWVSHPSRLGL